MNMKRKVILLVIVTLLLSLSNVVSDGFSYWDTQEENQAPTVPIGSWSFYTGVINPQLALALSSFVDTEISNNPNSTLQTIYDQSGNNSGTTITIENMEFYEYQWDIFGSGTGNNVSTMGYISLIDRSLDGGNNPIHDIRTVYTTTPSFPEYNYFISYDATNTNTNNLYGLRLNYGVQITTDQAISNLSNISFYAASGLTDPSDPFTVATNRNFIVSVSPDGITWTQIGSANPPAANNDNFNFSFYSYSVPGGLQGQPLFLRLEYNGEGIKSGKNKFYSRLIIDEMVITTN